jgi:hypothetical protein
VHWSETDFTDGVYNVTLDGRTLRARTFGPETSSGALETFVYVSSDQGRTWTRGGQLASVTY